MSSRRAPLRARPEPLATPNLAVGKRAVPLGLTWRGWKSWPPPGRAFEIERNVAQAYVPATQKISTGCRTQRPPSARKVSDTTSDGRPTMNKHTDDIASLPVPGRPGRTRIVAIPGSLRLGSYNRKLLEAAREFAPTDVEVELWDGLKRVPPFDEDDESDPAAAVIELREAIAQADALLIATPEYNASLPGQLKNALDWASRPRRSNVLRGKPVAVIGAGPRPSAAVHAVSEARVVLDAIGAQVLDAELAVAHVSEQFDDHGHLAALARRRDLRKLLERLSALARDPSPELAAA
jgi:chromate reductase, NAD(P)H dehydrogenase (quinone)